MKMLSSKDYVREVLKAHKVAAMKENAVIVKEEKEKKKEAEEKEEFYKGLTERQGMPQKYNEFMTSVKEEFLSDCIYSVFNESLNRFDRDSKKHEFVKKTLVKNFVQEQGVDKLLTKFRNQNLLLSQFAYACDKAVKSVAETTTVYNKNSWTVDDDIKNQFIDDLKDCNSKEAIITITDRVADAETEFVNDNVRKKLEIDDILQAKKERLDAMEGKPEEIKESVAAGFDRKVKALKNKYTSTIYRAITESMTKNAFLDDELKQIYIKEGNLDLKSLTEDAGIMYTFLETLYTTEMVDESYIKNFVGNI